MVERANAHSFTHPLLKLKNTTVSMGFLSALLNCSHHHHRRDRYKWLFLLLSSSDHCCACIHPPNAHSLYLTLSISLTLFVFFRPPTSDAAVGKIKYAHEIILLNRYCTGHELKKISNINLQQKI